MTADNYVMAIPYHRVDIPWFNALTHRFFIEGYLDLGEYIRVMYQVKSEYDLITNTRYFHFDSKADAVAFILRASLL